MNQVRKAKKYMAEREADSYYIQFEEILESTYGVRKHGYMWENKKIFDKSHPDYKKEKDFDIDNSIIQSNLSEAILIIGNAALALIEHGNLKKRTKYFKTAIIYYETITAYEHAFSMAERALLKNKETDYFTDVLNRNKGIKNKPGNVVFEIDELLDKLNNI